jgi:lipoprotein-anchoring transpeptidase ErfK/SrfK
VWWYDDNGNVVHENTDYIGVRRSNGCIRMLRDDAKYLYDRYGKGDHILIHE